MKIKILTEWAIHANEPRTELNRFIYVIKQETGLSRQTSF